MITYSWSPWDMEDGDDHTQWNYIKLVVFNFVVFQFYQAKIFEMPSTILTILGMTWTDVRLPKH